MSNYAKKIVQRKKFMQQVYSLRTISLLCHTSKIMLKILAKRIESETCIIRVKTSLVEER